MLAILEYEVVFDSKPFGFKIKAWKESGPGAYVCEVVNEDIIGKVSVGQYLNIINILQSLQHFFGHSFV